MRFILLLTLILVSLTLAYDEHTEGDDTMTTEKFPDKHWAEMKGLMESDGTAAVVSFIESFNDDERRQLYAFAHQGFSYQDWEGKNFDGLISIVEAGIAEGLRQAETTTDVETRNKRVNFANVLSYNLSADLATCWPGDEVPREQRHLERGLAAAEQCVAWREELDNGDGPRSMAWWAVGMHNLSLGNHTAAEEGFQKSFDFAVEMVKAEGNPTAVAPGVHYSIPLGQGYLGLALLAAGDKAGQELYDGAIAAFEGTVANFPEQKDDTAFCLDQLRWVESRL